MSQQLHMPKRTLLSGSLHAALLLLYLVAAQVLEMMQEKGVSPRASTYKALLRSWRGARDGTVTFVVTVVGAMAEARVAPDVELLEMATDMCAKAGGVT